jgi:hypothetical protein
VSDGAGELSLGSKTKACNGMETKISPSSRSHYKLRNTSRGNNILSEEKFQVGLGLEPVTYGNTA